MAIVVETILLDGNPKGLKMINIANWSGKAFVVPRSKLKEFRIRAEAELPGIYFLFGDGQERPVVYIGQSENVGGRLAHHDAKKKAAEWNSALIFVGNLDSTFVKYLESITLDVAIKANRCEIVNSAAARPNRISEAQKIAVDEYFDRIKIITGLFGYSLFDETTKAADAKIYIFEDVKNKDASARGTLLDSNEFVVYAGSRIRIALTPNMQRYGQRVIAQRNELLKSGKMKKISDTSYELAEDQIFSTPSAAADFVAGRSCNGWTCWKDSSARTLDQNVRQ